MEPCAAASTRAAARRSLEVLDFGEEPHDLELGANPEWDATTLRLGMQSLTVPASVYDHDLVTGERTLRKQTPTPGVDLTKYVAERTWAQAEDGTEGVMVPVDVVRHVDTPVDGSAPASCTATAPTSTRWRRGSASPGCRCSTAAPCGRSYIRGAGASSVAGGTSTASC